MADTLNGIFISELLADNAGNSAIDTDNDGNTNKADEFIELQNATGSTVSLDGYEIWSEKNGLLYSFDATDTLAAGETATVVGNYSGTVPAGYYDAGVSEGTNWLPDGEGQKFDTIFLVDTNTGDYIILSYGQPPRAPTLPNGFPGTNQVGPGETINSSAPNGVAFARDENGVLVETTPTPGTPNIPCFLNGTQIETARGHMLVEHLNPGDLIVTKDAGHLPLRAIGRFQPTKADLLRNPGLAPVCLPAGSVGNRADLYLSGAHRILLGGPETELFFGQAEVLVPSRHCVGRNGIHVTRHSIRLVYYHLVFDTHVILRAQGSWTESLFLADLAQHCLQTPEHWRIQPGTDLQRLHHHETARMTLRRFETQLLFASRNAELAQPLRLAA